MEAHRIILAGMIVVGPSAFAGEILIDPSAAVPASRNEQQLDRIMNKAREHAGKAPATSEADREPADPLTDGAASAVREAQDYLRGGTDPSAVAAGERGVPIILRAAPLSEAEKQRQKARSFVAPPAASRSGANCGVAATNVGTIGEGAGAALGANVSEKGNSAINGNCR